MGRMNRWMLSTNRTLCDCLEEMRKCYETRNFSYLPGLIEEAQTMGNRMETGLYDLRDLKEAMEMKKKLKQELRELEARVDELKPEGETND